MVKRDAADLAAKLSLAEAELQRLSLEHADRSQRLQQAEIRSHESREALEHATAAHAESVHRVRQEVAAAVDGSPCRRRTRKIALCEAKTDTTLLCDGGSELGHHNYVRSPRIVI